MKRKLVGVFFLLIASFVLFSHPVFACVDAVCGNTCPSGFETSRGGCKTCRCTPSPKVIKTWTFNVTIDCPVGQVLTQKVRFFSASFLEGQNLPNEFYWDYQPYSYDLNRSLNLTNYTPNDSMYIGLESDVLVSKSIGGGKQEQDPVELIPTGTPPNTIIEYGKWFNPQTSMAKFSRDSLAGGTYTIKFSIPDTYKSQWCALPCAKKPEGDANCDGQVDEADYGIFKTKMGGATVCANCSADFNTDGKTDLVDYEIWRNTVYK